MPVRDCGGGTVYGQAGYTAFAMQDPGSSIVLEVHFFYWTSGERLRTLHRWTRTVSNGSVDGWTAKVIQGHLNHPAEVAVTSGRVYRGGNDQISSVDFQIEGIDLAPSILALEIEERLPAICALTDKPCCCYKRDSSFIFTTLPTGLWRKRQYRLLAIELHRETRLIHIKAYDFPADSLEWVERSLERLADLFEYECYIEHSPGLPFLYTK